VARGKRAEATQKAGRKTGGESMKIGIIGLGYVGSAVAALFGRRYDVVAYDPAKREHLSDTDGVVPFVGRDEINACDVAFICVPTPEGTDGRLNVAAVEDVVSWLSGPPLCILKSTVPVGTTERLARGGLPLIFSPEYVGESSYWTEEPWHRAMIDAPWYVFGGPPALTSRAVDMYLPVCGPQKRYVQTDSRTAELAKLAENSFYAAKVLLFRELSEISRAHGVPWHELREVILADPRMSRLHTGVWQKDGPPFSGKCFPKDISELVCGTVSAGYVPRAFLAVRDVNANWEG
jgi:UDPglucose 6-dehydrogenase